MLAVDAAEWQTAAMDVVCADARPEWISGLVKSLIVPRPIGWISTVSKDGAPNLAPYSFFNAIEDTPPILMFASGGLKDSARNCQETGEFVANFASAPLAIAMNATSAALGRHESEFLHAGLTMAASSKVRAPRVAEAAAALECRVIEVRQISDMNGDLLDTFVVFGQVLSIHVEERLLHENRIAYGEDAPLGRLGGANYAAIRELFQLKRP